jgi:hypothetical protein
LPATNTTLARQLVWQLLSCWSPSRSIGVAALACSGVFLVIAVVGAIVKCARCGRDWTAEPETRLQRESSDYWQVMCSCGAQLSAESSGADIHLLAGLEWRPA